MCVSTFDFSAVHSTFLYLFMKIGKLFKLNFAVENLLFIRFNSQWVYGSNIEKVAEEQRVRTKKNTDTNGDKDVILVVSQII